MMNADREAARMGLSVREYRHKRDEEIIIAYGAGHAIKRIARRFGLGNARVRQIIAKHERLYGTITPV